MLEREPLFPIKDNFSPYGHVKSVLEYGHPENLFNPKVSVVVPIFNHPEYLEETLLSIINQDYEEEYEIIVVDNNMTKPHSPNFDVIRKLNSPKVLYYRHEENIRFEGNCNRGVELARGEFISFCHDDDLFLPDALTTLMTVQKQSGDKGVISNFYIIDDKSNILISPNYSPLSHRMYIEESIYWLIERCSRLQIGSLWNRKKFIATGGYSPRQAPCQDYGLHAIYGSLYGSVYCVKPTFKYRKANNASQELYKLFPERERFIMNDLAKRLWWLPYFYKKLLINLCVKKITNSNEYTWGKGDVRKLQSFTTLERVINRINTYIYRYKTQL